MKQSPPLEESGFALSEIRREIARHFGEPVAGIVCGAVARGLHDAAERAEAAGLPPETAVAGFLHVCREFFEDLQRRGFDKN